MTNPLSNQQRRWKAFSLLLFFQLTACVLMAQVRFSGKVTAPDGSAIPGITVQLRNTSTGATSGADGQYTFMANVQGTTQVLEFSGIGFKTISKTVTVSGGVASADAVMEEDVLKMDEVVVIGSSLRQSRKQLGNTVNSVDAKQLQNTGSGNLSAALQGKVPGAQISQTSGDPAGGISIRMRGTSTIMGSSEPLYVVDGVVISNATNNVTNLNVAGNPRAEFGTNRLADINPNDIEKIDVIPGASASAIYGARASNGVVLITTKSGKAGQLRVDVGTSVIMNELRKKVYISKYGKQFGTAALRLGNISDAPANTPFITYVRPDGQTRKLASGLVDVTRYDYQDEIFQRGLGTDNYVSLSGGTEKTKYYFSGAIIKMKGSLRTRTSAVSTSKRASIRKSANGYLFPVAWLTRTASRTKSRTVTCSGAPSTPSTSPTTFSISRKEMLPATSKLWSLHV